MAAEQEAMEEERDEMKKAVGNKFMYGILMARMRKAQYDSAHKLDEAERAAGDAMAEANRRSREDRLESEAELGTLRAKAGSLEKQVAMLEADLAEAEENAAATGGGGGVLASSSKLPRLRRPAAGGRGGGGEGGV